MFSIRMTAPAQLAFESIDVCTVEDAVGSYMERHFSKGLFVRQASETAYFATVEVEGVGSFSARHFYAGFGRAGGVKLKYPTERQCVADVERDLGLAAGELSDEGWLWEESWADAYKRRVATV